MGTNTTDRKVILWLVFSNNKKKAITDAHIINALTDTNKNESEQYLDISHLNVNVKIVRRIIWERVIK